MVISMKVNIYYGGRGLIDDPTLFVIAKLEEVFSELNVKTERYMLHEQKNVMSTLPQTMKDVDGVILATTVEWLGIGGYMQEFLDDCWLYGDKEKISKIYMFPVVMAKTYGEREAEMTLKNAWDLLGGKPVQGLCAYVDENSDFEFNPTYVEIIEKYAESVYRTISQKRKNLPSSNRTIKQKILKDALKLTPQESEQLSKFASDDTFVKTQKKDIEELASMFKEMLNDEANGGDSYYTDSLSKAFKPQTDFAATYMLMISDKDINILIDVNNSDISITLGENNSADVIGKLSKNVFESVVAGRVTFQKAFMTGSMTAKGSLKTLRMLDEIFDFSK